MFWNAFFQLWVLNFLKKLSFRMFAFLARDIQDTFDPVCLHFSCSPSAGNTKGKKPVSWRVQGEQILMQANQLNLVYKRRRYTKDIPGELHNWTTANSPLSPLGWQNKNVQAMTSHVLSLVNQAKRSKGWWPYFWITYNKKWIICRYFISSKT